MRCSYCGQELEPLEGQRFCSYCGNAVEISSSSEHPRGPQAAWEEPVVELLDDIAVKEETEPYCAWEDHEQLGFFQAMTRTLKESLFRPEEFFGRLPVQGGLINPFLFGVILETFGGMAGYLWSFGSESSVLSLFGAKSASPVLMAIAIPVGAVLSIMVVSVVLHVCLYLLGAAKKDFEATFRVICYASGPAVFDCIPVVGWLVSGAWKLYLTVVGLRSVHGISTGQAVSAVAIPLFICCGFVTVALLGILSSAG